MQRGGREVEHLKDKQRGREVEYLKSRLAERSIISRIGRDLPMLCGGRELIINTITTVFAPPLFFFLFIIRTLALDGAGAGFLCASSATGGGGEGGGWEGGGGSGGG